MPHDRLADPDARAGQAQPYDPARPAQPGAPVGAAAPGTATRRSSQSSQSLLERYSSHGSQEGDEAKSPYSKPGPSVAEIQGAPGGMQPHIQFM